MQNSAITAATSENASANYSDSSKSASKEADDAKEGNLKDVFHIA